MRAFWTGKGSIPHSWVYSKRDHLGSGCWPGLYGLQVFVSLVCLLKDFSKIYLCFILWLFCLHVYMCTKYMPSAHRGEKTVQMPWHWSYWWLRATLYVLGTEPGSSARAASVLNHWAISSALFLQFSIVLLEGRMTSSTTSCRSGTNLLPRGWLGM